MKLIYFIFVFSLLSCSDEESTEIPNVLLPGTKGSYWNYTLQTYDVEDSLPRSQNYKMTLTGKTDFDGVTGYEVENIVPVLFGVSFPPDVSCYYMNSNQGLMFWRRDNSEVSFPQQPANFQLYFKFPATVGDTLLANNILIKTESVNDVIKTSSGTYECIKYIMISHDDTIITVWIKPKLGIIKSEEYLGGGKIISELNGFSLNQ